MDLTCVICLDEINSINNKYTLKCGHIFHKTCMLEYFDSRCPICKQNIITTNIYSASNSNSKTNFIFKEVILYENNIKEKLTQFFSIANDEVYSFILLLNKNVILSGEFILSVILNETYPNNILDLYIDDYAEYHIMQNFLIQYCKFTKHKIFNKKKYKDELDNTNVIKINAYIKNDIKIYIYFNNNNLYLVKNYVDLDFLKNYYDGDKIYVYDETKLNLKIDYISKKRLSPELKKNILYYRKNNFDIRLFD